MLLVQVGVIGLVERTGTGGRVPVLESVRDLVVGLSLDVHGHLGCFEPVVSCGFSLL